MPKILKSIIKLAIVSVLILGGFFVYYFYFSGDPLYSKTQTKTIESFGKPAQFSVAYLPRGEDSDTSFVRQEVWFYPSLGKKFMYLAGELTSAEELEVTPEDDYGKTMLEPAFFSIYTTIDDVKDIAGEIYLAEVELPVFSSEEVKTYMSREAIYVFDQGYLTYVETID